MLDPLLLAIVRIGTFSGKRALTAASGFFFRRDEQLYLVTSRHVFIDEDTDHHPDRVEIELHADAQNLANSICLSALLYRNGRANWRQGRDDSGGIDVAVLEIDTSALSDSVELAAFTMENLPTANDHVLLGQPVLIAGFPLGFHDDLHHLPVVRQGAVASPYGWRFQGRGWFLTDARTHRGISGAPVIMRAPDRGPLPWLLVGIHSTRFDIGNRDLEADESLGLNAAWYPDIVATLTDPARASEPADPLPAPAVPATADTVPTAKAVSAS